MSRLLTVVDEVEALTFSCSLRVCFSEDDRSGEVVKVMFFLRSSLATNSVNFVNFCASATSEL